MWAITSSSERWPIGLKRAMAIVPSPAAKQAWRQAGTDRPSQERTVARCQ